MTFFVQLCNCFEKISATPKRNEINAIFSSFLKEVISSSPQSLSAVLLLATGTIYPQHANLELGIGEHIIQTVVAAGTGLSLPVLRNKYIQSGDLATVAMHNRVAQLFVPKQQLTVAEVLSQLRKIAAMNGKNATNNKKNIMLGLISLSSPLETKYIVRLFECQLKIGLATQSVLTALGMAFSNEENNSIDTIKEAYNKNPDLEHMANALLKDGPKGLFNFSIVPGIPVKPMLAQPSGNLTKAFSKVEDGDFLSEFKYDGERVQIHHLSGQTKIFSRNSEDITVKYPDIAALNISEKSFILDGEAVAFKDGEICSFQLLSTRKRKNIGKIDVDVCVFVFDLLFYETELVNHPLSVRREILRQQITEIDSKLKFASGIVCSSVEEIDAHLKTAIEANCEGVMLKSLASNYRPSHRSNKWVKVKKDYLDALGDSLDLIVIGAFYGKGKRTGQYGGFLLAVYNQETGRLEPCCKIGTGFSEEQLREFYEMLSPLVTSNSSRISYGDKAVKPDVWIEPKYVWEVKAASLSRSPIYSAGGSVEKGISLRFPRFIRERRDKQVEEATTSEMILKMYNECKDED